MRYINPRFTYLLTYLLISRPVMLYEDYKRLCVYDELNYTVSQKRAQL